jgi:hypothetical protein
VSTRGEHSSLYTIEYQVISSHKRVEARVTTKMCDSAVTQVERAEVLNPSHFPSFDSNTSLNEPMPSFGPLTLTLPKALRPTLAGAGWVGVERGEREG